MIPLAPGNDRKYGFRNNAFGFSVNSFCNINAIKTILHQANTNHLASQKESPSLASMIISCLSGWVQTLM
jgi:hypothetical protein